MTNITSQKRIWFVVALVLFSFPIQAYAARLYFIAEPLSTGENEVRLMIDAKDPVNTFDISVEVPQGVEIQKITDANSIIKLWIEKPAYNKTDGIIQFSGIIPEGFRGSKTTLLKFNAITNTQAALSVSKESKIYLNTESGILDKLQLESVVIEPVTEGKELAKDTERPENFKPIVTREPLLNDGKAVVIFKAEDKQSGIAKYEIYEGSRRVPENAEWVIAESPYVLMDQELKSYIHIRAVDNEGNTRVVVVSPQKGFFSTYGMYAIWGILIVSFVAFFIHFLRRKR